MSITMVVMPWCLGASGLVRTVARPKSDRCAPLVQTFWPLISQPPPATPSPHPGRPGPDAGRVGPGAWLAEQLAPDHVLAERRADPALDLFGAGVLDQGQDDPAGDAEGLVFFGDSDRHRHILPVHPAPAPARIPTVSSSVMPARLIGPCSPSGLSLGGVSPRACGAGQGDDFGRDRSLPRRTHPLIAGSMPHKRALGSAMAPSSVAAAELGFIVRWRVPGGLHGVAARGDRGGRRRRGW
jgi:hypothetical protein